MSGRVIKFRAWHKGYEAHDLLPGMIHDQTPGDCLIFRHQGQPIEVMQYTGLRDNKRTEEYLEGQEVYEGDIFPGHFNRKARGVVRFGEYVNPFNDDGHGGHVGFYVDWKGDRGLSRKDLAYWVKVSHIIGNAFENPELMGDES